MLRASPSASISSLAQLEALTKSTTHINLKLSSQPRKNASSEQPRHARNLQVPRQRRPKTALSRTSSWWTIGTGEEFSDSDEVAVAPAGSSCAYETEAWEGDDEMDDDDNDTEIVEEKTLEAQEVDIVQMNEEGNSHHDGVRGSDEMTIGTKIPEELQPAPPVMQTVLTEESKRSSSSAKKRSNARARKSSHDWAWRCFLWCCVVERMRGRG